MKFDLSESNYRIILFVALYILSGLMIYLFFNINSSAELRETLSMIDKHSTAIGFKFYAVMGILQYGLLILGISIFSTLTFMIIRRQIKTTH